MTLFEKILIKFQGNSDGKDYNVCDWDILTLADHWNNGIPLTKAEQHAKAFLEDVGEVLNRWHPVEKWKRPYGQMLNETRKLH